MELKHPNIMQSATIVHFAGGQAIVQKMPETWLMVIVEDGQHTELLLVSAKDLLQLKQIRN